MKLEDQYLIKWFLKCRKMDDDSLKFLAIPRGGEGAKTFSRGQLPPCPPPLATPLEKTKYILLSSRKYSSSLFTKTHP